MNEVPDLRIRHSNIPENAPLASNLNQYISIDGNQLRDEGRLNLLTSVKDQFEASLTKGCSYETVRSDLYHFKSFMEFIDCNAQSCNLDDLETLYLSYSEILFQSVTRKKIKPSNAYNKAKRLSNLFGSILDIPASVSLLKRSRISAPKSAKKAIGKSAEKQNLADTFKLGEFLVDIVMGLTKDAILGEFPLQLKTRGKTKLAFDLGNAKEWLYTNAKNWSSYQKNIAQIHLEKRQAISSLENTNRHRFVNMRIQAELMLFIAQTGMNLTQARKLEFSRFKYKLEGESWSVRGYKSRRGGEYLFKIYKSYRPFLERYKTFVSHFFPHSKWLFPFYQSDGSIADTPIAGTFYTLKPLLKDNDIPWIPPQQLRNTRVNWLLRRSGDADLTAEMAQHTKKVLRDQYELPSQQRAMVEITQFWNKHDPIKRGELKASVISSECNGNPEPVEDKPDSIVEPNCVNPSGCLWCKHMRDRDSEDYVWSLASMRYLKSIEAKGVLTHSAVPADLVIDRLTAKLEWYRGSSEVRNKWVEEAEERIDEGYFHPNWSNLIEFLES